MQSIQMKNYLIVIGLFLITTALSCGGRKKVIPRGTEDKKAYILFGDALKKADIREYDEALVLVNKALKKDPEYIDALDLKGNILKSTGRYEEAKVAFQKILAIHPDHVYALTDLSRIHYALHEYDDCLRILNQLLPVVGVGDKRVQVLAQIEQVKFAKYAYNHPVPFDPQNLGPAVNTEMEEYFPGLDIQEKTLYFTRRDGSLKVFLQNEDLFVSEIRADGDTLFWTEAQNLGRPVNTRENEGAFSASPDGKHLFFTSCSREGGIGRCDIWYTTRVGENWTEPKNLGRPVNTREWESQPSISADGVTLYFVSNRPGGYGGNDIWYSKKTANGWGDPINLGPEINTPGNEEFPFIHNDGVTLYYSSDGLPGMGGSDIFITRLINNKWAEPINIGYPINTVGDEWNMIVNRKGDMAYIASSGLKPNYGGMDIYSFKLYEKARPNKTSYVHGIVYDIVTGKKLKSDIDLFDLSSGQLVTQTYSDSKNGSFLLNLPANNDYACEVRAEGYLFHSENFSLKQSSLEEPFELKIGLKPIQKDQTMVMQNVLFDVDKWDLKSESFVELDVLVNFLNNNPSLHIEIGGHTDNTGSEDHNKTLSNNRAKSVYQYLVNKGITADRLSYKGYGSSVPVATNDTPEGRSQNRRTEVKILKS